MAYLNSNQRNVLEKAVLAARKAAENGAKNALQALAVHHHEPYQGMDPDKRVLRNRLRSKGRLLGDRLESNDSQQIENLASELAYEYWHKMLFARFLEANGLLIHPSGVSVSLQECEELAQSENLGDKWNAASVYASKMLPAIFRPDDPVMMVEFATEDRINLEAILEGIPNDIFTADDSLGWVYQFWQTEVKEEINKSGDKIDGKRLPAVTQLFTEPYMVHFLIDNSIGAWWVGHNPGVNPPVEFKYLRYLEDGTPAAGKFEGWPTQTKEITSLDPCMGSGHFLVAQFDVFVRLRMFEEGLNSEDAAKAVISANLFGLEIDPRCTQIAAFNLALAAWKFVGKYFVLPDMNLACSGVAPQGKKEDWIKLAGRDKSLRQGMEYLYSTFQNSSFLGSLIEPNRFEDELDFFKYEELLPLLEKAILLEGEVSNFEEMERGVAAKGIAVAGKLLSRKYTLQITNVPYLTIVRQSKELADYCKMRFPNAKSDLANVFLERMFKLSNQNGTICIVMPHNWLFLDSYKKYRRDILSTFSLNFLVRLGEHAFENSAAAGAFACLVSISKTDPGIEQKFMAIDVSNSRAEKPIYASEKRELVKQSRIKKLMQNRQLKNPDAIISFDDLAESKLLGEYAHCSHGLKTSDDGRFKRYFSEVTLDNNWIFISESPIGKSTVEGKTSIFRFEDSGGKLTDLPSATVAGRESWSKSGIQVGRMSNLPTTYYWGEYFKHTSVAVTPKDISNLSAISAFCFSENFSREVRKINKALAIDNGVLKNVPFDLDYWQKVAQEKYPNGLPKPYSDDPTQWLFHGNPKKTNSPLQVAVARFLGYRWPAETDEKMELADEARELIKDVKQFDNLSDDDGIVCIPSVNGELSASDRIREYLSGVFGSNWQINTLEELLKKENAKNTSLENWLRDEFFEQHYKLFKNRPFIWQIWDGRKDGFSVLVNYHKLTKENLQKLIYTYLGDWIRQCEAKVKNGESGAEGLLFAAQNLKEKLELILQGESPYDIFVRWKPLEKQPIGWDPDINDGVRLNIRPLIKADILRKKPKINWGIDRGKNPPGTPWGEIRDNDRHLCLKEKLEAREK